MHSNLWKNIINILKNYSAVFIFKRLRKWQNLPTDYSTIYMVIQLKYNICIYTRLLIIFYSQHLTRMQKTLSMMMLNSLAMSSLSLARDELPSSWRKPVITVIKVNFDVALSNLRVARFSIWMHSPTTTHGDHGYNTCFFGGSSFFFAWQLFLLCLRKLLLFVGSSLWL